ncbi:MAG: TerC family protein [Deltaproteobacteria bacterium]|nr:TerC family protein [Deltaproteobacteria bacterium]
MVDLFSFESLIAFLTLVGLEIVLGIDNIVFIAITTDKLPQHQKPFARRLGLALAMVERILLLFLISWLTHLTEPLFAVLDHSVSGRDLILLVGGVFLIGKATLEIHAQAEPEVIKNDSDFPAKSLSMWFALAQIVVLDTVFSLDSVLTAVGMVDHVSVMVLAIIIAVIIMMVFANPVSNFILRHPTLKTLALAFLLLVGVFLVAEGLGSHIEKGYIYFAIGFSVLVEALNFRVRHKAAPPPSQR